MCLCVYMRHAIQGKQALAGAALKHALNRSFVSRTATPQRRTLALGSLHKMPKRFMAVTGGEPAIIPVPAMGDSISEGTIAVWHKKAGDDHTLALQQY